MRHCLIPFGFMVIHLLPGGIRAQDAATSESAIRQVLSDQVDAWNRGDVDGFMDGYWRSDSLRFVSGGSSHLGWSATRDRYHKNYPNRDAMGTLSFTLYRVNLLSSDYAFVFGRYKLDRKDDQPTGLFTLLFRRFDQGWRIVFDHTSSDAPGASE